MRNIITLFILLSGVTALAGGYQTGLQGNVNQGMGSTGLSLTKDVSSMFYNPGALGMADFQNYSLALGLTGALGFSSYSAPQPSDYSTSTSLAPSNPFYFYLAKKLSKHFTLGICTYTPFNSSIHWKSDWKGKYIVTDFLIKTYYIQPTLSYNLSDKFGVGVGLVYGIGKFGYNFDIPGRYADVDNGTAELEGTSSSLTNIGVNAGIMIRLSKKFKLGLSYRSAIKMKFNEGDVKNTTASSLVDSFPNTTFKTTVPMPAVAGLGISYQVNGKLLLALEGEYTFWNINKSLEVDFKENTSLQRNIRFQNDFINTFAVRLGGEYTFSEKFRLRAGAYYELTPVKKDNVTPLLPDANHLGISLGAAYSPTKDLSIDFSVQYVSFAGRDGRYHYPANPGDNSGVDPGYFEGKYTTTAIYLGIGVTYKL